MFGIRGLQAEGWWSGWVTRGIEDGWRIHNLAPGLTTAIACNGRGVAMGPIMGRELARYVSGTAEADLIVPVSQPKEIFGHLFHRPFAELAVRYYGWRDRREMKHSMQQSG
jgi:glycine/D-amino acid oxidase-like deaminating enzyme